MLEAIRGALEGHCVISKRSLFLELQRYKYTRRCVALGTEILGHCQDQLTKTLHVRLLKKRFCAKIFYC